jgi:hypothetical protein
MITIWCALKFFKVTIWLKVVYMVVHDILTIIVIELAFDVL